ncbi:MAG: hypothetical protein KAI39_03920, partial [Desulfobulbaceae bacterium]|nr:hypothetical protein [Desulfobulbaceae bacterium]
SVSNKTKERGYTYPLYIYSKSSGQQTLCDISPWPADADQGNRTPNINPKFVKELEKSLGLTFSPTKTENPEIRFTPEDIFHYIYAILHSPTYRSRYAQFLKIDFPKIPLPADATLFTTLCDLGRELARLHLLTSPTINTFITSFPQPGDNLVEKGYPKYIPPKDDKPGRIRINKDQYFEGITQEIWDFHIGGYQVLAKWLKDRRGRLLSYQDLTHYQKIVVALRETIHLMEDIDKLVKFPMATK